MILILGMKIVGFETEILDDEKPGVEGYTFMGLHAAIAEAKKRIEANTSIERINIYKVHDGVRSFGIQGQYELVYFVQA